MHRSMPKPQSGKSWSDRSDGWKSSSVQIGSWTDRWEKQLHHPSRHARRLVRVKHRATRKVYSRCCGPHFDERRAEAQLGQERADVTDAAMQSLENPGTWEASNSGSTWSNKNSRQSDRTEQLGSSANHGRLIGVHHRDAVWSPWLLVHTAQILKEVKSVSPASVATVEVQSIGRDDPASITSRNCFRDLVIHPHLPEDVHLLHASPTPAACDPTPVPIRRR